jgi:hypothetical protein
MRTGEVGRCEDPPRLWAAAFDGLKPRPYIAVLLDVSHGIADTD